MGLGDRLEAFSRAADPIRESAHTLPPSFLLPEAGRRRFDLEIQPFRNTKRCLKGKKNLCLARLCSCQISSGLPNSYLRCRWGSSPLVSGFWYRAKSLVPFPSPHQTAHAQSHRISWCKLKIYTYVCFLSVLLDVLFSMSECRFHIPPTLHKEVNS